MSVTREARLAAASEVGGVRRIAGQHDEDDRAREHAVAGPPGLGRALLGQQVLDDIPVGQHRARLHQVRSHGPPACPSHVCWSLTS